MGRIKLMLLIASVAIVSVVVVLCVPMARGQVGKSQGVLDPNIAGREDLLTAPHFDEKLVAGLLEKRPFLTMTDLNKLLSEQLKPEELTDVYGKLFVSINLNTATKEEVQMIPGVGARMLREFQEYRPYKALAQFHREIGKYVDDKELARLEQYVFVPIDLNSASDEDIQSIPGVGARMLREFKEYRPYKNIEQFRREIGKYVDKKEVARLERYVTIK